MTAPFVASNGLTVIETGTGYAKLIDTDGITLIGPFIGRFELRALVEYAKQKGIRADDDTSTLRAQVEAARGMALTLRSNVNTRQAGVDMLYAIEGATGATEGELDAERFEVALDHIEKAKQAMYHAREAGS